MLLIVILVIILLLVHLAAIDGTTTVSLVVKPSVHHIGLRNLPITQDMIWIIIHYNIIFLDNSNATDLIVISFSLVLSNMLLWMSMELLTLYNMTSQHLRILYFNLRVIEYVVIVVYVLYYLNGLILILLFGLGRSTPPLMGSM